MYHPSHPKSAIADAAPAIHDPRQQSRTGRTRRGFLLAGLALALGAITVPFLPGKKTDLDPKMLLEPDLAKANKKLIRDLCLAFHQYPDAEIRYQCARFMASLPNDPAIKNALWYLIRKDAITRNRDKAIQSLIRHYDPNDIPQLVDLYYSSPASCPTIDQSIEMFEYEPLRTAIKTWISR